MKNLASFLIVLCAAAAPAVHAQGGSAPQQTQQPATVASVLDSFYGIVERQVVSAAAAMPEDKYSFAPSNGEFKGVRTFAQQVKHVAAVNYVFGSAILGEKMPVEGGENGPDSVKTKADIMKFLKDSFEYLRKAEASLSDKNQLDQVSLFDGQLKAAKLSVGAFACAHPMDHYGQM